MSEIARAANPVGFLSYRYLSPTPTGAVRGNNNGVEHETCECHLEPYSGNRVCPWCWGHGRKTVGAPDLRRDPNGSIYYRDYADAWPHQPVDKYVFRIPVPAPVTEGPQTMDAHTTEMLALKDQMIALQRQQIEDLKDDRDTLQADVAAARNKLSTQLDRERVLYTALVRLMGAHEAANTSLGIAIEGIDNSVKDVDQMRDTMEGANGDGIAAAREVNAWLKDL